MTYKQKLGRKKKDIKIYSIKRMLPKKYRNGYRREIHGDKLHLVKK